MAPKDFLSPGAAGPWPRIRLSVSSCNKIKPRSRRSGNAGWVLEPRPPLRPIGPGPYHLPVRTLRSQQVADATGQLITSYEKQIAIILIVGKLIIRDLIKYMMSSQLFEIRLFQTIMILLDHHSTYISLIWKHAEDGAGGNFWGCVRRRQHKA